MEVRRISNDELYHFGIEGMKWGVRRYQNKDGSLTEAGKSHYYNKNGTVKKVPIDEYGEPQYEYSYTRRVNRIKRTEKKAGKLEMKASKAQLKSDKYFEKANRTAREKRYRKLQAKGFKQKRLASSYAHKAMKEYKKGNKYYKRMEREFSQVPVSYLNPESVEYAKRYAQKVLK